METKIKKTWWGLSTVYSDGISISGGKDVTSDKEIIEMARQKVEEDDTIKYIEAYRVDLPYGKTLGDSTILITLQGKNIRRNPFDDEEFRNWYCQMAREQD